MTQLPHNTNLEQLKSQAKALLKQARVGDAQAVGRFAPYFTFTSDVPPKLYQAQLIIARELGYSSWPKLKEALQQAEAFKVEHQKTAIETDVVRSDDSEHVAVEVEQNKLGQVLKRLIGLKPSVLAKANQTSQADISNLHCSFCGKSKHEIKKLIAGPGIFICDECVGLCNQILNPESG